jgi:excisionase family DNA binding protein
MLTKLEPSNVERSRGGFKLKEACDYIGGVSQVTMRRLIDRGLIKPNRALRHILISRTELDRFLSQ